MKDAFVAFGLYALPVVTWVLIYSNSRKIEYVNILIPNVYIAAVIGYLGVIQYFVSPTLFDLIPLDSNALKWAQGKDFSEYSTYLRSTSTLGSPQVFGLYCALFSILSFRYIKEIGYFGFILLIPGLLGGGIVTSNKLFFVVVFGYFAYLIVSNFVKNIKLVFFAFSVLSVVAITSTFFMDKIPILERVFSVESIIAQEKNDSRIGRYIYIVGHSDPLVGHGLGTITNKSVEPIRAPESYFFKVYYEAGFVITSLLLLLCLYSYLTAKQHCEKDAAIVALTVFGMIVVHAFESPVFIIIWGHLIGVVLMNHNKEVVKV
ncbi:hypothetical protein L4D06_00965 [Enterovibrio makurazakiensis]|uniref:hypothetical protein n=1 Tax=Enterovibrio makurazakiensis TaxID=2910232 RepID=UPI003D1F9DAE